MRSLSPKNKAFRQPITHVHVYHSLPPFLPLLLLSHLQDKQSLLRMKLTLNYCKSCPVFVVKGKTQILSAIHKVGSTYFKSDFHRLSGKCTNATFSSLSLGKVLMVPGKSYRTSCDYHVTHPLTSSWLLKRLRYSSPVRLDISGGNSAREIK